MVNTLDVPVRLASVLLMSNAQITMAEIQSLPFVNNRQEANAVAQNLMRVFSPRYRIEVSSGLGSSDVKLRLETAPASTELRGVSAWQARSRRRVAGFQSPEKHSGRIPVEPSGQLTA